MIEFTKLMAVGKHLSLRVRVGAVECHALGRFDEFGAAVGADDFQVRVNVVRDFAIGTEHDNRIFRDECVHCFCIVFVLLLKSSLRTRPNSFHGVPVGTPDRPANRERFPLPQESLGPSLLR